MENKRSPEFMEKVYRGCEAIIHNSALLQPHESVLIVSDTKTYELGKLLKEIALKTSSQVDHHVLPPFKMHGEAPPKEIAEKMLNSNVVLGITSFSMAHSKARLKATESGAKYISLPDYNLDLMTDRSLQADFQGLIAISKKLADLLTEAELVELKTAAGTEIKMRVKGRKGNPSPGCCFVKGIIASPPDAETNIAIVENSTTGVLVVDGSIPCDELGLLKSNLSLTFKEGRVVHIEGEQADTLNELFDHLRNPKTRIGGEFGIGLNPEAELCGLMLPDEGALGTVHIGIGANATIGGVNSVPFHLDHIIREATILLDGKMIMENGDFLND